MGDLLPRLSTLFASAWKWCVHRLEIVTNVLIEMLIGQDRAGQDREFADTDNETLPLEHINLERNT